jgi:hypothetical protein
MSRAAIRLAGIGGVLFGAAGFAYLLWPVCVIIPAGNLLDFKPPVTERTERHFYGRVFQLRDGAWYQCKTRAARTYFS